MTDEMIVKTNHVPRPVIHGEELTEKERAEFDYIDWKAVEEGEVSPEFIRYKGQLYDLHEFQTTYGMPEFSPLRKWGGYMSDSFFSGIVVKYCRDYEFVVVGQFFA